MWGIQAADLLTIVVAILTLVFLEGLLSADNALVLAVMVRHLPKVQQKQALHYGILGAFGFRLIAVLFAATLLDYWIFKVAGGVYLLYLAISHFLAGERSHADPSTARAEQSFWATVVGVELADIAFSIDSIVAAVAMAEGLPSNLDAWRLWIVYIGGILGIITMRFVAGYFLILLDRFSGLAAGAYFLVVWIGLKLIGSGLNDALHPPHQPPGAGWRQNVPQWLLTIPLEMSDAVFWAGMALIVVASLLYKPRTSREPSDESGLNDDADLDPSHEGAVHAPTGHQALGEESID
jgi:YkoY family integral membrane protein